VPKLSDSSNHPNQSKLLSQKQDNDDKACGGDISQ